MIHAEPSLSRFALNGNANLHFHASSDLADNAKMTQSTIGKNIKRLLQDRDWSETRLSEESGVHQTTINRIIKGQIRSTSVDKLERMASALGVSTSEITDGHQPSTKEPAQTYLTGNPLDWIKVPVIDWSIVGTEIPASIMQRKDMICPVEHNKGTFALTVQGMGMQAPQGRTYAPGSLIFVDPSQTSNIDSGDAVVAILEQTNTPTFRIYYKEGDTEYLMPLNLRFPPTVDEPFRIIGKVIGSWSL